MSAPSLACKPLDTPPSSDVEASPRLPPSPPQSPKPPPSSASRNPIDRVVGILALHRAGKLPSLAEEAADQRVVRLTQAQFVELHARITAEGLQGWWEDKSRYDWEPAERAGAKGRLVLRMPSAVHDKFAGRVSGEIWTGIAALAGRLAAEEEGEHGRSEKKDEHGRNDAAQLRKMEQGGSATVEMRPPALENSSQETASSVAEETAVRRSPDGSFYHPASDMPSLVLEVGYSQQRKSLADLAESYIVDSQHAIRCVVTLDIPYASARRAGDRTATVSVWRPARETNQQGEDVGTCRQDVVSVPFRDKDGNACDGALELAIHDLLPPSVLTDATPPDQLNIPFSALAAFLTAAETKPSPTQPTRGAPTKWRKRKRSPEEALHEERERKFLQQEITELARERAADGEWRIRSRRRGEGHMLVERRSSRRLAGKGNEEDG